MSLELAAQHLASRGRKGDSMLVHMAPQEVSGLQALAKAHGGTLTLNPDTGLPEANFLKSILPTLIGAGLSVASGGTLTPLMAAMVTGGGYAAATGSLSKGLMAGLGAYGGAGLLGGLSAAGTAAAGAGEGLAGAAGMANPLAGMEAAALENAAVAPAAGVQVGAPIVDSANLSQTGTNLFGSAAPTQPINGLTFAPETVSPINAANIAPTVTPAPQTDFLSGMDQAALENKAVAGFNPANTDSYTNIKRGLSGLMDNPASRDAFMTKMGGDAGLLKTGMMAAAPALMGMGDKQVGYKGSGPNPFRYRYEQRMPEGPNMTGSSEALQYQGRYVPYANGGPVDEMSQRNEAMTLMADGGQMFARGGISHLGDYSDGGRLLKGPGDGVSDSIPATIANKRPARLADGEFVVPARIVSELGNGSTEAGARKLYAMMDRVQKARKKSIGKNRVAINSRADKMLPA
jgi:hypothetical protein